MSKGFSRQKHEQPQVAKKQISLIQKPTRERALCGASIKQGKLYTHELRCPQCKLAKSYKSKAA